MASDLSVLGNAKVYALSYLCGVLLINLLQNEGAGQPPLSARPL